MSSMSSTSATRPRVSSSGRPSCRQPNATSSSTVAENTCASEFWKTNPTWDRNDRLNSSSSSASSVTGEPTP